MPKREGNHFLAPPKLSPRRNRKTKQSPIELEEIPQEGGVKVNLVPAMAAPSPKLMSRKPPQVDAEGNEVPAADEQQEKTFFQKYWWVLMIAAVLTLGGGGGGK